MEIFIKIKTNMVLQYEKILKYNSVDYLYRDIKKKSTEEKIEHVKKYIGDLEKHEQFEYDLNYTINSIASIEPNGVVIPIVIATFSTLLFSYVNILNNLNVNLNNEFIKMINSKFNGEINSENIEAAKSNFTETVNTMVEVSKENIYTIQDYFLIFLIIVFLIWSIMFFGFFKSNTKKAVLLNIQKIYEQEITNKKANNQILAMRTTYNKEAKEILQSQN